MGPCFGDRLCFSVETRFVYTILQKEIELEKNA